MLSHQIVAYRLIREPSEQLEEQVNQLISQGWQPLGSPAESARPGGTRQLVQAVVIYGEPGGEPVWIPPPPKAPPTGQAAEPAVPKKGKAAPPGRVGRR
jgi:hypothetical protein